MGNQLYPQEIVNTVPVPEDSNILSRVLAKIRHKNTPNKNNDQRDEFIISFHKSMKAKSSNGNNNMNTEMNTAIALDPRRTVFVSVIGLYQTFELCPSHILYASLLIMPLKKKWVLDPALYADELDSHFVSQLSFYHRETDKMEQFRQLLLWKDSQSLVFWTLDDYAVEHDEDEAEAYDGRHCVDPFWKCLSLKLCAMYDAVNRKKYKPLNLNTDYWRKENKDKSQFCATKESICSAFENPRYAKFRAVQEILYKSNPESLKVVIYYGQNKDNNYGFVSVKANPSLLAYDGEIKDVDQEAGEWFISMDYDANDTSCNVLMC